MRAFPDKQGAVPDPGLQVRILGDVDARISRDGVVFAATGAAGGCHRLKFGVQDRTHIVLFQAGRGFGKEVKGGAAVPGETDAQAELVGNRQELLEIDGDVRPDAQQARSCRFQGFLEPQERKVDEGDHLQNNLIYTIKAPTKPKIA